VINISLSVSPVRDVTGKIIGASKIARDITLKTRSELAERSVGYLRRIVKAEEAERQRMARDLHDHLGQKMTALRLQIEKLYNDCEESSAARGSIAPVRALAEEIDRSIGFFSWEYREPDLENTGLFNALKTFVKEWSLQFGIPAVFQQNEKQNPNSFRFDPGTETNLYRIAQEALNNIAKHANATTVAMMVQHVEGHLTMVIEDDGDGFDMSGHMTESGPGGMGLTSMEERAEMIGGTFDIESALGRGTSVIVKVPTDRTFR
jgi:signal transduction histidine kinase